MHLGGIKQKGFTIVELLIVIVVIGILAALVVSAFSGAQQQAREASLASNLASAAKTLQSDFAVSGQYPASLGAANGGKGIVPSEGEVYEYYVDNSSAEPNYCLIGTSADIRYGVSHVGSPTEGGCGEISLLGAWYLNGNAVDATGSNSPGTITGATPAAGQNGSPNAAYNFSATGDLINLGYTDRFNTRELTYSAWIRPASTVGYQGILAKEGNYKYRLNDTSVHVLVGTPGTGWTTVRSFSSPIEAGSWWHVAVSISSSLLEVTVYVNGEKVGTETLGQPITTYNANPLLAGSYSFGGNEQFIGDMDDLRMYKRALGGSEIKALYMEGAR